MRNILLTGGSRGLGLATATRLADAGFRVIAVARKTSEALEAQIAACAGNAGRLSFCAYDLSDTDKLGGLIAKVTDESGHLYGIVNNAGIGTSGILATMPNAQIEALIRLNVVSVIMLTKYAVRSMMVGGAGRVINISSIVSVTGYSGLSVYSASKAALGGFTRSLARELGPLGITVNTVAPGFIATEMTGEMTAAQTRKIASRSALKRMADASDVAGAVAFLMGDGARNITGTTLTVDAGNTA